MIHLMTDSILARTPRRTLLQNLPAATQLAKRCASTQAPPQSESGPSPRALLAVSAAAGVALGVGVHHALQTPKPLGMALQSHDTDTVVGALVDASLMRCGYEDAAKRLLLSRSPHTREKGATFLLEHAPLESTLRYLQRQSELEADSLVQHQHPWSLPFLAAGGIEAALHHGLATLLERNPGLEQSLLAATDRDAQRLRPLLLHRQGASPAAHAELVALLEHADAIIRRRAMDALQQTWPSNASSDAPPAWLNRVDDPDRNVRRQVCRGLGLAARSKTPPAWVASACELLAQDADPLVSHFATAALTP